MFRIATTARIALGLALLSTTGMLWLHAMGLGPRENTAKWEGRRRLVEMLVTDGSLMISRDDTGALRALAMAARRRFSDIESISVFDRDGCLVEYVGSGEVQGAAKHVPRTNANCITLPLHRGRSRWGEVRVQFGSLAPPGLIGFLHDPFLQLVLVVTGCNLVIFVLYLKTTLQRLAPSRVVPDHVRNAFDTIAAGLVIIDNHERVVLANREFIHSIDVAQADLLGRKLSRLAWRVPGTAGDAALPWNATLAEGSRATGITLHWTDKSGNSRAYIVNCAPILAQNHERRGALVSFENITELETKKAELSRALTIVESSRDEIRKQNRQLQRLATEDPLTSCMNRRSFFELFESYWTSPTRDRASLSCIMLDIDHFKAVNDDRGHAAGDMVLQKVASAVCATVPVDAVVGRYGGEEFCILLPGLGIRAAVRAAGAVRAAVEQLQLGQLTVTVSLGVSCGAFGADTPQAMVEQADKCLYAAKHNGRNQVVRWDDMPKIERDHGAEPSAVGVGGESGNAEPQDEEIARNAVSALMAALEYRDRATAKHSRRVADLCMRVAGDLLSVRECYILETAALLHDIGKIGIPDSILRKPGPLTDDERKIMDTHDRLGVEIIAGSLSCPALVRNVEWHHRWYRPLDCDHDAAAPAGDDIPLGARILAVAEAYDSMTAESVYRQPLSREQALAELRRGAGTQFDPAIVKRFIVSLDAARIGKVSRDLGPNTELGFGYEGTAAGAPG